MSAGAPCSNLLREHSGCAEVEYHRTFARNAISRIAVCTLAAAETVSCILLRTAASAASTARRTSRHALSTAHTLSEYLYGAQLGITYA